MLLVFFLKKVQSPDQISQHFLSAENGEKDNNRGGKEKQVSNLHGAKLNSRCLHDAQVPHVARLQQHLPELQVLVPSRGRAGQTQLLVQGAEVHVHHVRRCPEAVVDGRELGGAEALGLLRLDGDLVRTGGGRRSGLGRRGARHATADAARQPRRRRRELRRRVTVHVSNRVLGRRFVLARLLPPPAAAVSVSQPLLEAGVPHVLDVVVGAPRQLCGDRGPPVDDTS
jgi:hypothetical protein